MDTGTINHVWIVFGNGMFPANPCRPIKNKPLLLLGERSNLFPCGIQGGFFCISHDYFRFSDKILRYDAIKKPAGTGLNAAFSPVGEIVKL